MTEDRWEMTRQIVDGCTEPNQDAKADNGKPRLSLVPMQIVYEIATIREYGNKKYPNGGVNNWKQVDPQRLWDACLRHIIAASDDFMRVDDESGYKHISHAACNLAFLLQMIKEKDNACIHR